MKEFMLQSKWTQNTRSICLDECTTVTFLIIGIPDPSFIGRKSVLETQAPTYSLAEVFGQYPNADLGGGKNCKTTSRKNKCGLLRVTFTCELENSNVLEACKNIHDYVDPGQMLDESTTNRCTSKNGTVSLSIFEKCK